MRMRHSYGIIGAVGIGLSAALMQTSCFFIVDVEDCSWNPSAACVDGGSGSSSSSSTGGTGGSGGGDGGPPPGCIPSENVDAVADTCGVFVSSSKGDDTTGKGTKDAPFATITQALVNAKGKPVYACGELFDKETVAIATDAALYGGLDCANAWKYDAGKKTRLEPTMDAIPLRVSMASTSVEIFDFAIASADATRDGGSSIAVLVAQATASFTRCDVTAGSGKAGIAGAAQAGVMTPAAASGKDGTDNAACTMMSNIFGGDGGTNTCNGTPTNGGKGGKGAPVSTGDNGSDGSPMMTPGNGGSGQTATASCSPGQPGLDGSAVTTAMSGTGARGIGDVSASGFQGPAATLGGTGAPGQGGGGGGAARACDPPMNNFSGPSAGGGGAGGCGGLPGSPGQSGGSSIGILALSANLALSTVTITAKDGGVGGLGGNGQLGGNGGSPGHAPSSSAACDGGKGGQGGAGGPGGGGAGGHSAAIAIKGGKMPDLGGTTIQHGNGAPGGAGGDMDMTAQTKGDDGLGCTTLDFTNPTSPTACAM